MPDRFQRIFKETNITLLEHIYYSLSAISNIFSQTQQKFGLEVKVCSQETCSNKTFQELHQKFCQY